MTVRYFSHEAADMSLLLRLFADGGADPTPAHKALARSWQLRFICLLWLSVVALLPFSIHALIPPTSKPGELHTTETAHQVVNDPVADVALRFACNPGKDRDGAALLLARYLSRPDSPLESFLVYCRQELARTKSTQGTTNGAATVSNAYLVRSLLDALCAVLRLAPLSRIGALCDALYELLGVEALTTARYAATRTKLAGRVALVLLDWQDQQDRGRQAATSHSYMDQVEVILQDMLDALEDNVSAGRPYHCFDAERDVSG